jgi:cytochrome P450
VCLLQALSWTFYLLMQHPEVEQKLLQEIHEVLGPAATQAAAGAADAAAADASRTDGAAAADSGNRGDGGVFRPSYDHLRRLRYARAVFMEALRLYPSVPEVGG